MKKLLATTAALLACSVFARTAESDPPTEDRTTVEDRSAGEGKKPDAALSGDPAIAPGPFKPDYESLKTYQCPRWYQDAKFGIWAHWGPQGVPEQGDWYARNMYVEGSGTYQYHLAHYGHPSKFGYKDIIGLWKAEKFDPDRLIGLYKAAGARYFVSMACHHDNFDLWNSKYHRWNAVNMGPKKDIVGLWREAALKQGLRFGISEHMAPSYKWFSVAHNADKQGPSAGVPYDGNDPRDFDLYGPVPEKIWSAGAELWSESDMPGSWKHEWYLRVRDVIDTYKPDYVYSDYGNVPFRREVGWKMLADFYNDNMANHGGKLEAVYTGKGENQRVYVRDYENSKAGDINAEPWQMDKCIANFFYDRRLHPMPAPSVVHLLVDVVSKNGNLLLSVPQRPDGTIDAEEEKLLTDMAGWMAVNGEAIFGSRPFKIYGENSPPPAGVGADGQKYTAEDIRFTVKGDTLFALTLGVPSGEVRIKSLRRSTPFVTGEVKGIELLGYAGKLDWKQGPDDLVIQVPTMKAPDIAAVFRITGLKGLAWDGLRYPAPDGSISLDISRAENHGASYDIATDKDGTVHTAGWTSAAGYISWHAYVPRSGHYELIARTSAAGGPSEVTINVGDRKVTATVPATTTWYDYHATVLDDVDIKEAGPQTIEFRASDAKTWRPLNLISVGLKPVDALRPPG